MRVVFVGVELVVVGSSEERREECREHMRGRETRDMEGTFCASPRCQCLPRTQRMVRDTEVLAISALISGVPTVSGWKEANVLRTQALKVGWGLPNGRAGRTACLAEGAAWADAWRQEGVKGARGAVRSLTLAAY